MNEIKMSPAHTLPDFGATDSRMRDLTLNVALTIAILTTFYFGARDAVHQRTLPALVSLIGVIIFSLTLLLNIVMPRLRKSIIIGFVLFVGMVFLALLATRFPAPTIVFWCFTFPLVALFLLGSKRGVVTLVIYNLGVLCVFALDIYLQFNNYTYDYAFRYCGVMIVISILSYYYETSRSRSHAYIHAVNQSLEQRVRERTNALEESQERLRQAEKLEAVGLLAGGIAHDFNNQLAAIMGFADLIRVTAEDNSEIRELAESIIASSRRSADLTGQLLAFARKGHFLPVPLDIHRIITDVISLLKHTIDKRIMISRKLDAAVSTILGDANLLHNALLNCALNARDAMPQGGDLVFATDTVDIDESYYTTLPGKITPGTYLHLCITDTGCGMDKNTLKHIFEPFFTTKEPGKGTGMGLSAVYGTVQSHNGAITVSSTPGSGSSFHLYFPLLKTGELPINVDTPAEQRVKAHGHILLVEDEKAVSASSAKMLEMLGYTVTTFENGKKAVDYYENNWSSVDCVILDMVMPVMGGKETFSAMKRINPAIVALLASGYGIDGEATNILALGVKGFIQKPFTIAEMQQKIPPFPDKHE